MSHLNSIPVMKGNLSVNSKKYLEDGYGTERNMVTELPDALNKNLDDFCGSRSQLVCPKAASDCQVFVTP